MKAPRQIHGFAMACCLVLPGLGQSPPPNDNYTNRIILEGTDISFSGTLSGATREADPYEVVPQHINSPTQTVWWEWTPTQSTTVIIQILNPSKPTQRQDAVQVYQLENIYTGQFIAERVIDTRFPHNFLTFSPEAGTNYQIQLAGSDSAGFRLRLIATNLPYIIEHPQSQTISAGDSVMFGVVTAGSEPFSYQWQFGGTNLPGETSPMIALDHATTNQAGTYRIVITNSAGTIISQPANLIVTPTDTAPRLGAMQSQGSNAFSFALLGDVGRRYRVYSCTNLIDWIQEAGFPTVFSSQLKSVVFDATGADSFILQRLESQKFFRATPFHAINEVCNNNLKQLRFAQLLFAYDYQKDVFDPVTFVDLLPYIKNGQLPVCPSGGNESVTIILADPQCSLHPFEER